MQDLRSIGIKDEDAGKWTTMARFPSQELGTLTVLAELPASLQTLTHDERQKMEACLVRKLDMRLMVPLILMYILNYLDRYAYLASMIS